MTPLAPPRPRVLLTLCLTLAIPGILSAQESGKPGTKPSEGNASKTQPSPSESGKDREGEKAARPDADPDAKVVRTEAEWRRRLNATQFAVTRLKATEPPFTGKYATGHYKGIFACVGCGAALFDARTKFDSGTGWPSFYQAVSARAIEREMDFSMPGEARVEVLCRRCDSHLGHVFNDGPAPTGLRFCINSASIALKPPTAFDKNGLPRAEEKSAAKAEEKPADAADVSAASNTGAEAGEAKPAEAARGRSLRSRRGVK